MNKAVLFTVLGLLLIGGIVGTLYLTGVIPQAVLPSGTYIQAPVFMYYECAPASQKITSTWTTVNEGGGWFECPTNSDECDFEFGIPSNPGAFGSVFLDYKVCKENSAECTRDVEEAFVWNSGNYQQTFTINNILKEEQVYAEFYDPTIFIGGDEEGRLRAKYNPFILWRNSILGGGRTEYTTWEQGCVFPSAVKDNLIERVIDINIGHNDDSSSSSRLDPYKTRNFISSFVPISTQNVNVVDYRGTTGYCINGQIYSIGTVETEGETYRVVDTNWNSRLGTEECCPGDRETNRVCNDNFQWQSTSGSECSLFNPCSGVEWFPSGTARELKRYECVNGYCEPEYMVVECARDSDCIGNPDGQYCDTSIWECTGAAPPNQTQREICDNGIDDDGDGKVDADDEECGGIEECGAWVEIGGVTILPDFWCIVNNWIIGFRTVLSVVLGVLSGLIVWLISRKLALSFDLATKKEINRFWYIPLGVGVLLGLAVGFLAFVYFWTAVLILIALGLIKAFVPGI